MKRLLIGTMLALSGCAAVRTPTDPRAQTVPIAFVSETEDAWLHDHCQLVEYGTVRRGKVYADAELPHGATFVEMISTSNDMVHSKFFACPARPGWYTAKR